MRSSRGRFTNITLVALSLAIVSSTSAQSSTSGNAAAQTRSELAARSSGSIGLIQIRPQGALGRNIGFGYGVSGAYLLQIDHTGFLSLRADIGVVAYGNDSRRTALSESIGGRVQVNVRSTNYIIPMGIGPQLTLPTGVVRPYVNAGVGGQGFLTESSAESTSDGSVIASTSNQSSFAAAWTTGAGVYVPIRAGKARVQLDMGMQYVNGAESRYLAPGSIADMPGGQINISAFKSSTHLIVLRLGARIGL